VHQRLATIARSGSILEREQRRAVLKELTLQLEAITGQIAQADPAAARELLWQFLELGNNVLGCCDDSSGLLCDVFRQAMGQLGRLTEATPPDPAPLAEQVFEAFCDNGYSDQPEAIRDGVGEALRGLPGGRSTGASHCRAQCCHVRHTAQRPAGAPQILELVSRTHQLAGLPTDLPIQELMRRLAEDPRRTERIVAEALHCWGDDRKLLLLSERTDHITAIAAALAEQVPNLFLLHGRLSGRQRIATRLLAMPVSWKGTLQPYAGRLHRQQAGKTSVRLIDWLDLGHPVPQRMWERRLRGYRAMGYELTSTQQPLSDANHGRVPPAQ
jgi:hypothetical protein